MHRSFSACLLLVILVVPTSILAETCLSNEITGDPTPSKKGDRTDLYRGQQAFTVSMLDAIRRATPKENVFFSPYSTYHTLLLAYFGARNQTEKELAQVLNLQWAQGNKNHIMSAYHLEKRDRLKRSRTMPLEFSSVDKIFFNNDIPLEHCMTSLFNEELESMDFRSNSEQCRLVINNWIANVTRNEIPDMLSQGDVSSETQIVLANAAYFKGSWASQFSAKDTKQSIFHISPSERTFVPMMYKRGTYNLALDETLQAHILQMPYLTSNVEKTGSNISMVIILPPFIGNSLETVLSKLTPDTLESALKESIAREIDVALPKFEFEQRIELTPILKQMGLKTLFDNDADFTGFSKTSKIVFGDAKHVAKIKVDEEGSTASASTVFFSFRSSRPAEPTKFECDHPFLFLIYDQVAQAILFTGIYRDPKTQK